MLVLKREGHRFDRPIEQYEETIGLVDLASAVMLHRGSCHPIMLAQQLGGGPVAEALDQAG